MRLFGQCIVCHKVRRMHISPANQNIGRFIGTCDICEKEEEEARKEKQRQRR